MSVKAIILLKICQLGSEEYNTFELHVLWCFANGKFTESKLMISNFWNAIWNQFISGIIFDPGLLCCSSCPLWTWDCLCLRGYLQFKVTVILTFFDTFWVSTSKCTNKCRSFATCLMTEFYFILICSVSNTLEFS